MSNTINKTTEEQLLAARKEALNTTTHDVCAHGKFSGLDAFSWINPNVDMLASMIDSLPYPVYWIGCKEQVENCLTLYPELSKKIASLIIQDSESLEIESEIRREIPDTACFESPLIALKLFRAMPKIKGVLLFTCSKENGIKQQETFKDFVSKK